MLSRVSALSAFGLVLSAVLLQAQSPNLFVLPGAQSASQAVEAFIANPGTTSTPVNSYEIVDAGSGSFAVFPLTASKFFVVASSTANSIVQTNATFAATTPVAKLLSTPSQAIVTPDGRLLAVAAGTVHLFDTASNEELVSGGVSQGIAVNTFAIAASLDSTAIFALGANSVGGSQLDSISTSSHTITATLPLSAKATAVSVGPNGLIYVSLASKILEVEPRTLTVTTNGTMSVTGTPGPFVFTPDGLYAVCANQSAANSLFIVTLATHTATTASLGIGLPSALQVIGVDTLLTLSSQGLYQVPIPTANPFQVATELTGISGITTTNDVPSSAHNSVQAAYLISSTTTSGSPFSAQTTYNVSQYNPASGVLSKPFPVASNVTPGAISYAVPPVTTAQSNLGSLLTYGNNQTIPPSATSQPLVVQVLDTFNVPLSGITVQFQTSASGATLSTTSFITGSNGYALTYLTASATPGPITVTATAVSVTGSRTATFSVNVNSVAQTGPSLTIIAGQGQYMLASTTTGSNGRPSLQVQATDASRNPIPNLAVTFSVPSADGTIQVPSLAGAATQTVKTNSAGVASVDFLTTTVPSSDISQGYLQSLVTASAANARPVTFFITTVDSGQGSLQPLPQQPSPTIMAAEGSTLLGGAKAQVVSPAGHAIPNVALTITPNYQDPSRLPSVTCAAPGGVGLTDANGIASCDLTFGPRTGTGSFVETIGYTKTSYPYNFVVTAGAAATLQITQGNNQTGMAGQKLPKALVVHVQDSGGNTVTGASVSWQVVTAGTVILSNVVSVSDSNGNASALATLGSIGGPAQVKVTAGGVSETFNLTVVIPTVGIQKVSGDQQSTEITTAFASPLIVKVVDANGNGVVGAQVNFQVTAGQATVSPSSAMTDSTGQASTMVTAGATAGPITVSAMSSTFSASFTLTSLPVGASNITVINGESFDPNTGISPGAIAIVKGTGILPGVTGLQIATLSNGTYPTTFSGVTITFNGTPAPIIYVEDINGADRVAVQVPFEVQPGPAVALVVNVANHAPATVMVPVKPFAPGFLTTIYGSQTYAVALRPDGSPVSPTNPAQRGENIQFYLTGLGQATPTIATDVAGVPNQPVLTSMIVGVNNSGVPLVSAVYAPGKIGVYIITLQVPADTQAGPYQPVGIIAFDSTKNLYFAQPTYIPIQ